MTVYVYHEYCDNDAFGEMITKVFLEQEDARDYLKKRVSAYWGVRFDEVETLVDPETDTFSEDYIMMYDGNDSHYWQIDERDVLINWG